MLEEILRWRFCRRESARSPDRSCHGESTTAPKPAVVPSSSCLRVAGRRFAPPRFAGRGGSARSPVGCLDLAWFWAPRYPPAPRTRPRPRNYPVNRSPRPANQQPGIANPWRRGPIWNRDPLGDRLLSNRPGSTGNPEEPTLFLAHAGLAAARAGDASTGAATAAARTGVSRWTASSVRSRPRRRLGRPSHLAAPRRAAARRLRHKLRPRPLPRISDLTPDR